MSRTLTLTTYIDILLKLYQKYHCSNQNLMTRNSFGRFRLWTRQKTISRTQAVLTKNTKHVRCIHSKKQAVNLLAQENSIMSAWSLEWQLVTMFKLCKNIHFCSLLRDREAIAFNNRETACQPETGANVSASPPEKQPLTTACMQPWEPQCHGNKERFYCMCSKDKQNDFEVRSSAS